MNSKDRRKARRAEQFNERPKQFIKGGYHQEVHDGFSIQSRVFDQDGKPVGRSK